MSLQARHRYLVSRLDEAFGIRNEEVVCDLIRKESILAKINTLFRGENEKRLFFVCDQKRKPSLRSGYEASEATDETYILHVSDGCDLEKLPIKEETTVVYFVNIKNAALDPARASDAGLVYGTIKAPLQSLEATLRGVYQPLLTEPSTKEWGLATGDQKTEFLLSVEAFATNVRESIKSLGSGLELRSPEENLPAPDSIPAHVVATDPHLSSAYMSLLEDWCKSIEAYLSDTDRSRWETTDSGPASEIEYWRRRTQRLISITDQLKTKECKSLIVLLTCITKQEAKSSVNRSRVFALMKRWRQIDVCITRAATEAKDNSKFLSTLDRFLDPLSSGNPDLIVDCLPALMNALKMIHTVSRFFNTPERMTKLFMKITNQMISSSKISILDTATPFDPSSDEMNKNERRGSTSVQTEASLWEQPVDALLQKLEACLRLNEAYQEQYRLAKDKFGQPPPQQTNSLQAPAPSTFDFPEAQIFGKFDLFCRRLVKLVDMFSTVRQFEALAEQKLEGMDPLFAVFEQILSAFREKRHDLLEYHTNKFDRDYVDFNVRIGELETSLQHFVNRSFESASSIEQSLQLLKKYQAILHRENLKQDLDSKFMVIFHNYGLELNAVQEAYEAHKQAPPVARNAPPVAGNIAWARHLLRRIEAPMSKFQANATGVLNSKESKRIVRSYNKLARTLVAFEYLWYEAWCKSVAAARAGLQATLIIRHPDTGKLYVNFDPQVLQLIREAKCLARMGVEIPEDAKMVLAQEDRFKSYYNELKYILAEYDRVCGRIQHVTAPVLKPHLKTVEAKLRPGMTSLTWTSMNIEAYKVHAYSALRQLEDLIVKINDLVENRIEKNLKTIARTQLVDLPADHSVTLDEFVSMQEAAVRDQTQILVSKNVEVRTAVDDLCTMLKQFPLLLTVEDNEMHFDSVATELRALRAHYNNLTYQAILTAVRTSLNLVKKRVCSRAGGGFLFLDRPFFEVDVQLSVPSVRLSPSLDDVQRAINRAGVAVLGCAKATLDWVDDAYMANETDNTQQNSGRRKTFFDRLGCDTEIIKVALLLTGALFATRNQVHDYLVTFKKYDWLWKDDKDFQYRKFVATNPSISDYESELRRFMEIEKEIERIPPMHNIGALTLNTANLKLQLRNESRQWKIQYSTKVHQQARDAMTSLLEYVRVQTTKLQVEVKDLESLRFVMTVLKEIRERESSIEMELTPITDMYTMLEHYLPATGIVAKDEMDQKSIMRPSWRKLVDLAEDVADDLSLIQGKYKKQLVLDVRDFVDDTRAFRADFDMHGPQQPGIDPTEAVERLRRYKDELHLRERKMETYIAGEELFAMRTTKYPELAKMRKEIGLLDQLYSLYFDVQQAMDAHRSIHWSDVSSSLQHMIDQTNAFDLRCRKLPKKLREWPAYVEMRQKLTSFQELLPIVADLAKFSIKPRHWIQVIALVKTKLPYDKEGFQLKHIFDAPILQFKDSIEEICEGADKQLGIELKLNEIREQWSRSAFAFGKWKDRDVPILTAFGQIIDDLEEAEINLQTLLSMRHVGPFREAVALQLTTLSDTDDTLELWIKVQTLWTNLESVFMGGDIAKQMPLEAKKFAKIDRDFVKIMIKAHETKVVVNCCSNELLRNTLPVLYDELEKCRVSLESYLETKRRLFSRFYFVSNPALLTILSQGSDPLRMQPYYEKVFDSVSQVSHDRKDKTKIVALKSIDGPDEEIISLSSPVVTGSNQGIEIWLGALVTEMQRSLKNLCKTAAVHCSSMPLAKFVDSNCAQFALLGLQFNWTAMCQEALEKSRGNKTILQDTNKEQASILQELSGWCLTDLKTRMNRRKIETLVTYQVHQRDVFNDLVRLHKERKNIDANDFEWLKQARFYYKPNGKDPHGQGCCTISICDVDFIYAYEYLGAKDRLVITPLTDRCYITLSQALGMHLGGAPAGPAGTGKTETVKDLGRALGLFVVVTNGSDQIRNGDMAKIFKGLAQSGVWGCFDEFNRLLLPVLSVVAQQVQAIVNAKRIGASSFYFPGETISVDLDPNCAQFITMNPGYSGRQELPQNLKALFRSVAMMVPDREIIMKVKLCSVGYTNFTELAHKFDILYKLCEQQLSKQRFYDFGLRNILSVLRTAGQTKRDNIQANEEMLLMRTLKEMNLSKLVAQDVPLFLSLLTDLFPRIEMPASTPNPELNSAITKAIENRNLIDHPSWRLKVIQLNDSVLVRHGVMLVGPSGSGKSTIISVLQDALTTTSVPHKRIRMNPKAIRAEEMFGETDRLSGEWLNGIFAANWAKYADRTRRDMTYLVLDGPVDAVWVENLNTVLDDNKLLTLANGDRIPMTDNMRLLFEVGDLRNASPATVSRAGIIYVSATDLDWCPVLQAWTAKQPHHSRILADHLERYLGDPNHGGPRDYGHAFDFIARDTCPSLKLTRVGMVQNTLDLLSALLDSADLSESKEDVVGELERLVIFAVSWGIAGLLDSEDRKKWHLWLADGPAKSRNLPQDADMLQSSPIVPSTTQQKKKSMSRMDSASFATKSSVPSPPMQQNGGDEPLTIFDFCVNLETMEWEKWQPSNFEAPSNVDSIDWTTVRIPTVETCRGSHLLEFLQRRHVPVLVVGGPGTAKTTTVRSYLNELQTESFLIKVLNLSSATTPGSLQRSVEAEIDKHSGKNFGPPSGKRLVLFCDDLSQPEINTWGDQPTLELARQLVETSGVCFLDKDKRGDFKNIERLDYVAAMDVPGAGKNDIPDRLKRHFFAYTVVTPTEATVTSIYGQLLTARFGTGSSEKHLVNSHFPRFVKILPVATVSLLKWAREKLLPSPSKFHYNFSLRDLSRLFLGMLRTPWSSISTDYVFIQLWRHEAERVFADKLTSHDDKNLFDTQLGTCTKYVIDTAEAEVSTDNLSDATSGGARSPQSVRSAKSFRLKKTGKQNRTETSSLLSAEDLMDKCLQPANFVDFLREDQYDEDGVLVQEAPKVYELGGPIESLRTKAVDFLDKYNDEKTFAARQMNLVIFTDALLHLMRISRVLGMRRGNMLLVGVGGSGKQSLTRLAAYMARHQLFEVALTKAYNLNSFLDDLRDMYKMCGQQGKPATFLFCDSQIKDETFLECLNSLLLTGEVPGLFPKDELQMMAGELRAQAMKRPDYSDAPEFLVRNFFDTARANLHVVLSFSPVHPKFADRARKFPGLISGCAIDWFLPWPREALVDVSNGVVGTDFEPLQIHPAATREALMTHMAVAHDLVVETCDEYLKTMRRHVYQTPRSYLSFLESYKTTYYTKLQEIEQKSARVQVGLKKLEKGAQDVAAMKVTLAQEEEKLQRADLTTTQMLGKLQRSSLEAKKEADAVSKIKEACELDANRIAGEKREAEKDLAKAQPFVEEAERAVNSIKPNDLNELKKLQKPSDIIKLIFDVVGLLKMQKLNPVEPTEVILGIGKEKRTFTFLKDSYKLMQHGLLSDARFLQSIFSFSKYDKDLINDETIELMQPYLEMNEYNALVARNASKAAEGLCTWSRAMSSYHEASKIVKPKLEALRLAEGRLNAAQRELDKAESKLRGCTDVLADLQADFEAQMQKKQQIAAGAAATRQKMEQATALIDGLGGERTRWTEDSSKFDIARRCLVGDVALGCAFVSYCGGFNQEFRHMIMYKKLVADLNDREIPTTAGLDLINLLVNVAERGDWALEGLPTDPLSLQNGILVTRSSRYPLLIDPQGQALNWIKNHVANKLPSFGTTSLSSPRLRDQLEYSMAEGKALVITGIQECLDPLLDPVLEKNVIVKGKSKFIKILDKLCEISDYFSLYLTTRLPNPVFSPEDQAKTTVVDFTVTRRGLEEQLLARVIRHESRALEEQLQTVMEEAAKNTRSLLQLDEELLERLSANTGSLLDDDALINVLSATKAMALDVQRKLVTADETRASINEKRETYRPAATRGALLYFAIVDMTSVSHMYQTSLAQFQNLFDQSMGSAERAAMPTKRVAHLIEQMTYVVCQNISRGLYERDRLSFKLLLLLSILISAERLTRADVALLLRGGAALDATNAKAKPAQWLPDMAWLHVLALSNEHSIFRQLPEELARHEAEWRAWFAHNEPETQPVPVYEAQLATGETAAFSRLLLVRSLREDRTILCVNDFIKAMDVLEYQGQKVPVLGPRYIESATDTIETVYSSTTAALPVIFLLSAGADATDAIETFARKKKRPIVCVSMGEGQEPVALSAIHAAAENGHWVVVQNAHLGLDFMETLEELLAPAAPKFQQNAEHDGSPAVSMGGLQSCEPDFRLFLTTEPHPKFPIGLLQLSLKVTVEPPSGLRAGMLRSFTVIVDPDRMDRIETTQWRSLVYALCFLHSIIQERRKFGALGFCVPYEFNDADLNACLTFLERHLINGALSWPTLQYMVSEVQYGGKITDSVDRNTFKTYCEAWLSAETCKPGFKFAPGTTLQRIRDDFDYSLPTDEGFDEFVSHITTFPSVDSPEIFGLHPNADLAYRGQEVAYLLGTLVEMQPKHTSSPSDAPSTTTPVKKTTPATNTRRQSVGRRGSASQLPQQRPPPRSREDIVAERCAEALGALPSPAYIEDEYVRTLDLNLPVNIFLVQEVQRFQAVVDLVRAHLDLLLQASRGEVVITEELNDAMNRLFDARVPEKWLRSATGDEISWLAPTLGLWLAGLRRRDDQLRPWLASSRQRPKTYWLPGFFNPAGFLTAVQQEVTRARADDRWSLDSVSLDVQVSEFERIEQVRSPPAEGVYVHGLFLDGANWDTKHATLRESEPKALFCAMPLLFVTATSSRSSKLASGGKPTGSAASSPNSSALYYNCPVYRYKMRTDRYYIFSVPLATVQNPSRHWTLRGVAMLCFTT